MDNDLNFETYLFISKNKLTIYVNSETNIQLYKKESIIEKNSSEYSLMINLLILLKYPLE